MTRILATLWQRITDILRDLHARPWSLFCLAFAANSVALPYGNFIHDANLYGVQVLNRVEPGRFAGDLYFQYGSQDKYSLFSLVAAPVVARLGLPAGFFLLYILTNGLFLFALQRFVRAVIKDPIVSTVAVLFMAITPIPFGGLRIFHVNEWFLTPRIAANALVLLGLERLIAGRMGQAWMLVALALPLHPLMAFPGFLILAGWLGVTHLRSKILLAFISLAALGAIALLLDRPLAFRLFGSMDDVWRDSVHRANPYHFPLAWTAEDWLRIIVSLAVVLAAAWGLREREPTYRLLIVISGVAVVGLAGGILACFLPYALPLQGQAWRCVWPLELALYPLGFLMVERLWIRRAVGARLVALGLLAYLNGCSSWDSSIFWLMAVSAGLFGVVLWRGLSAQPKVPEWATRAALFALAVIFPLWTAFQLGLVVAFRHQLADLLEPVEVLQLLLNLVAPLCRLALLVGSLVLLRRFVVRGRRLASTCAAAWVMASLVFFVLPQTCFYAAHRPPKGTDERFVTEYLTRHQAPGASPTVYWPSCDIGFIWFQLRANIYLEWPHQIAGNLFSAETAREGTRRALIARKFEVEKWRKYKILIPPQQMRRILNVYQSADSEPSPHLRDFWSLCQETQLDFAVLPQKFDGLYTATNGRVFIYDCRTLRSRLNQTPSGLASSLRNVTLSSNQEHLSFETEQP